MSTEMISAQHHTSPMLLEPSTMDAMIRLSEVMATGRCTIPTEYQGKPGDCLAVVIQAAQWGMNPYAVAQKTYFIKGRLGYEGQLVNAVITAMAPTHDRLKFDFFGNWDRIVGKFSIKTNQDGKQFRVPAWKLEDEEGLGVIVSATLRGESNPREIRLLLSQCQTRNSAQWADDPQQQLTYVGTRKWARRNCPEVLLGVYTPDEVEQFDQAPPPVERDITPESTPSDVQAEVMPEYYPQDKFNANFQKWKAAIESGKKTTQELVAMIETRAPLSPEQKDDLEAI